MIIWLHMTSDHTCGYIRESSVLFYSDFLFVVQCIFHFIALLISSWSKELKSGEYGNDYSRLLISANVVATPQTPLQDLLDNENRRILCGIIGLIGLFSLIFIYHALSTRESSFHSAQPYLVLKRVSLYQSALISWVLSLYQVGVKVCTY